MKKFYLLIVLSLILVVFSCNKTNKSKRTTEFKNTITTFSVKFVISQKKASKEDTLKVSFSAKQTVDSVFIYANDSLLFQGTNLTQSTFQYFIPKTAKFGYQIFKLEAYKNGVKTIGIQKVLVLPKEPPKQYTYKVVKEYPHDPYAYTQGLVYEDGYFYESTGIRGESSIRKVRLETGEVILSHTLPQQYFGEGLAIYKDKLIQLTWKSGVGFVYDKKNFKIIREFQYNTEGWGLTFDGKNLIMSDGSNTLYFLEPQNFTIVKTIEVFDNKGPVKLLNELEFIKGKIYANIYTKDYIAIINPESGVVEAYVNLQGILKPEDRTPETDVLNGIAFDKVNDRIFITGKNWKKLFEVKFIPKN